MAEFLKKGGPDGRSDKGGCASEACEIMRAYPALTEFLACEAWEPGLGRITGTLLLCSEGGRWRAWLNDRDSQASTWVSGPSLTALLLAADGGLRLGGLDWRAAKPLGGGRGGRR